MSKPNILLVGMIHMAVDPTLVNERKSEIEKVCEVLSTFQPTKIAVEKSYYVEEEMNRRYEAYRNGDISPAYDEVEQIGFRIANALSHPCLFAVDEIVEMSSPTIDQVFEWAKQHQPELFQDIMSIYQRLHQKRETTPSFLHKIKTINEEDFLLDLKKVYMKIAQVGDRQHRIGVQWLKQWHHRDLAISANLLQIAQPDERILVFIGEDHLHLLQQLLSDSQNVTLSSIKDYM